MLTTKGSAHVRTCRSIKGLHACLPSTGLPLTVLDRGRMSLEDSALTVRQMRREWLARLWRRHVERCRKRTVKRDQMPGGVRTLG